MGLRALPYRSWTSSWTCWNFLIPNYILEGKNQLVIGIGCTGGKHRSVTLANKLFEALSDCSEYGVRLEHRDVSR